MGGVDTRDRYHVHWGPAEQYAERREESALRRSGRPVPDATFTRLAADRPRRRSTRSSSTRTTTRAGCCASWSGRRTRTATCRSPRSSTSATRPAPGTARSTASPPSYPHLRFEPGRATEVGVCRCPTCTLLGGGRIRAALVEALGTDVGGVSPTARCASWPPTAAARAATSRCVTVDGQAQPGMTADEARSLAERCARSGARPARPRRSDR